MRELIEEMANRNIGSLSLFLRNKKNIDYLNYIESSIPKGIGTLSEKVYYFVNKIDVLILCECGKPRGFVGFKNGYRPSCGDSKCYTEIKRKTCIEKYGVDNPKKSKIILEKEKKNILEKWGGEHYMKSDEVRKKFNESMLNNHGVEWAQQSKLISEKSKETFDKNPCKSEIIKNRIDKNINKSSNEKKIILSKKIETINEKWGSVDNLYKHITNKTRLTSMAKYGVSHPLSSPEVIKKRVSTYYSTITNKIKEKLSSNIVYLDRASNINNTDNIIELKCLDCDSIFNINRQHLVNRIEIKSNICLICNPILNGKSKMELEILEFIKINYNGNIITSDRNILDGNELDIYLPDMNLAFEFNGLYWHSELYKDKNYHLNKTNKCLDLNINLVHIWEDDWLFKQDIVKSIILNKLGKSSRIFARKCNIKIPSNDEVREFLSKNHIQGFVGSKVKIGLYYNDSLVSIMTFGNLRKSLAQKSIENTYELLRFCNVLNTSVIGGASKLFKYFINNYVVNDIISYSDNSRGVGSLYQKLGFEFVHESVPNYYYIIDNVRKHRFNYRKDKLVKEGFDSSKTEIEIMTERGYYRIFDCGSKKWLFKFYI